MVSHAASPGQVPEVQFRRGLGHSNLPRNGPLTVVSAARRLSANCCRLRHMRQASLASRIEVMGSAGFFEGMSRVSLKLMLGFGHPASYYHWNTGQNFRSGGRRLIRCLRHWSITITFTLAGMERRRSGASSAELARATERPTLRSTLSRTRY